MPSLNGKIITALTACLLLLTGCSATPEKRESGYYTSPEECPEIVKTIIRDNSIDFSLIHSCDVHKFKSTPDAYYVIIEYGPAKRKGFSLSLNPEPELEYNVLAKLYVKNKNIALGDGWDNSLEQIDLYSEESDMCSFPYGDWLRNIKNNKEIDWDLVQVNNHYYFKISFDNFVYPFFISKDIYEYPDWEIRVNSSRQCAYNGSMHVRTDVARAQLNQRDMAASDILNFTNLSVDINRVPIK